MSDSETKREGTPFEKPHEGTTPPLHSSTPQEGSNAQVTVPAQLDRAELIARARSFLASPQVAHQDLLAKRSFLVEKGLNDGEINTLLGGIPPSTPMIPPRNYPQPGPSNLPNLLLGIFRMTSWITGGAAILMFVYWRFLLPRISKTYFARRSLRSHYNALLQKMTTSLAAFKESQAESYSVLPRTEPYREPEQYSTCQTVDDVLKVLNEKEPNFRGIPPVTLMRTAIADTRQESDQDQPRTTEELFQYLEAKIPWLTSESGKAYEQTLWEALTSCPLFIRTSELSPERRADETTIITRWSYQPRDPPEPSQLQKSFIQLSHSLPRTQTQSNKYNHTLEALSELTGYISTQTYLPYRTLSSVSGFSSSSLLSPAEEELRREIRALKGLVLNRRSFMASLPRSMTVQQPIVE